MASLPGVLRVLAFMLLFCLDAGCSIPSFAQSSDRQAPYLLSQRRFEGKEELRGQSHYYRFEAGPGDVTVTVDAKTDYSSGSIRLVFSDADLRQLATMMVSTDDAGVHKVVNFSVARKQPVTLQVMFPLNVGVKVAYKVDLAGAVSLDSAAVSEPSNSAGPARDVPVEDKWALIIGVSKFQKPGIDLRFPAKDARDLFDFLISEGNFARDHVKLITDEEATKERVMAEIGDKWLPRLARPNDLVLIFISTHGSPSQLDLEGMNYLVLHNTDPDSLYATGLPLQEFANAIKQRVHSERVVLIIDACHSGAANPTKGIIRIGNVDSNILLQGTGQLVICSSQPNQVSWESKRYANGVFTRKLIEALRSSKGKASLAQSFERLRESVQSEVQTDRGALQVPVMKSKWQGSEVHITAPPAKPRLLPEEIRN